MAFGTWGYPLVLAGAVLENTALLGLVLPGGSPNMEGGMTTTSHTTTEIPRAPHGNGYGEAPDPAANPLALTPRKVAGHANPARAIPRSCRRRGYGLALHVLLDAGLAWLGQLSEGDGPPRIMRRWLGWLDRHLVARALHETERVRQRPEHPGDSRDLDGAARRKRHAIRGGHERAADLLMPASSCRATVQVYPLPMRGTNLVEEERAMRRSAGKTHTLYADVQWHKHANADCYRCGARERAHRMVWLEHPEGQGYLALCPACHPVYAAKGAVPPVPAAAVS